MGTIIAEFRGKVQIHTHLEGSAPSKSVRVDRRSAGGVRAHGAALRYAARMADSDRQFVSRAGAKLHAALQVLQIDVTGRKCVDFGSHTGGFVDCLLQHGAALVHAVDPSYGILDYRLRKDARVVAHERTNALTFVPPAPVDLVTIDVGWTPQRLILPSARRCLGPGAIGVVSLVKPHYEAPREILRGGVVPSDQLQSVLVSVRNETRLMGWTIDGEVESPIRGHGGNVEFLWLLRDAKAGGE